MNNQTEQANFVTVVEEPSNQFVDFFKVSNETGEELANGIWSNVIVPTESEKSLLALGTDGASNNVGPWNGAQRKIEEKLCYACQRFNCLYHMAERPFRQLQAFLDGSTNGPITTSGKIGKAQIALDDHQGPFVRFRRIQHNLPPELDREMLKPHCSDLLPLYDFTEGLNIGRIRAYLETRKAVKFHNARWRNHAVRTESVYG